MNTWEKPPENPADIWNDARWPNGVEDLQAASHLPLFLACIGATGRMYHTNGDTFCPGVIEIGVGFHSTPMLHSLLKYDRSLFSLESDPYWLEVFQPYATDLTNECGDRPIHRLLPDSQESLDELAKPNMRDGAPDLNSRRWSVVLVDDSPGYPRAENVKLFLPIADYVLVHDAQGDDIMDPMRPVIKDVPYQFMHKRYFPWTLALSNYHPIPKVP